MTQRKTDECCPEFNPKDWHEKTHVWKDKLFLQDEVRQIMHIPLNMGAVVSKMFKKAEANKAVPENEDFLLLSYDPSPWKSELYMTVTKEVPEGKMAKLSGKFISRVYDGPYNAVPQWIKEHEEYLEKHNLKSKKYYFHFAYCPKCMKKYGHNYCIAFSQVE
jgi:hypothetical protein